MISDRKLRSCADIFCDWNMGRAFGSPIYHAVEKMVTDPEVIARMKLPGGTK